MNVDDIARYYPKLYHMAESGSWPSIKKHGLLSTTALLDFYQIEGQERLIIESQWRPESVKINHPIHGSAVIRDQKPLPEKTLTEIVDGMTASEYYKLLNSKTFFWVRRERLEGLLNARAYQNRKHTVLTLDTKSLVDKYRDQIWLSSINSGAAIYGSGRNASRRSVNTFKRISEYPFDELIKRKKEETIVELSVDYAVKDVSNYVTKVEDWIGYNPIETIWSK
jgi:hypothetical protein